MEKTATSRNISDLLKYKQKNDGDNATSVSHPEPELSPAQVSETETETSGVTNERVEVKNEETTTDTTSDVVENGEDEVWFKNEELGIIYKTDAEAKRGLEEKEKYVKKLKERTEQLETRLLELESSTKESDTSDTTIESRIQKLLPEQYQNKTEEDFLDPDELKDFVKSLAKAEAQAQIEIEREQLENKNQIELARQRRQNAINYIKEKREKNYFGVDNSEDIEALEKILNEEVNVDGQVYTPLTLAVMAHEVDPKFSDLILLGLKTLYRDGRKQEVAKHVSETKTKTRKTADNPATKPLPNLKGRDRISRILKTTKNN